MRLDSAKVAYNMTDGVINIVNHNSSSTIEISFSSSADYQVSGIGWSSESLNQSEIGTTAWVFDTADDIFSKAHCQCVHETSTPCTPDYEDADGCQIGGPGSGTTACGIGTEVGGQVSFQMLGTGTTGGGTKGKSCSVSCDADEGFYACCNEY